MTDIDTAAMIHHVQPVANVQALAVQRHRNIVERIGDEERNDLLRKLVRARNCSMLASPSPARRRSPSSCTRDDRRPALLAEYGFRGFNSSVSTLEPFGTLP